MTELQSNGNYESYLAQLFNPQIGGAPFNPGAFGASGGVGLGGLAANGGTNPQQNPWAQNPWAQNPWAMQQNLQQLNPLWQQQNQQNVAQNLAAIQLAQQIAARQAVQAIQYAQALQALQQQAMQQQALHQLAQNLAAQQWGQLGPQGLFAHPGVFGTPGAVGQMGQGFGQFHGMGAQNLINQALQQQALQQAIQYLAAAQAGQFRYGLAA